MVLECFGSLLVFNMILATWVIFDSTRRQASFLWVLGTATLGPILFPVYLARRPLIGAEIRTGGPDWIVARHFAWVWTLFMAIVIFWVALSVINEVGIGENYSEDATTAANISRYLALLFLGVCWVVPMGGALLFSIVSYVDGVVEYGPEAPPLPSLESSHDHPTTES
ncbi:MAG: hypothetical protein CUN55_09205 [Phototrophicales bacterium]|nr:MAG: hypothetical protein CUN55_09205 [Phototrophicales bacterium]